MQINFTPEQDALRQELRSYFAELMTPELRAEVIQTPGEGGGPLFWEALKKLGQDGWIGLGWSQELGGKGYGEIEQMIFIDEVMRAGFPFPFLTTESVGPILAEHASESIKQLLVPKILGGEVIIAIGYSEPSSGTDLASLSTTAVKEGNEWVINGQKIYTSLAQHADYVWLAARTNFDPEIKKHRGISIFIVPTDDPGFSLSPIHTLGDVRTNATYYDNVRIPEEYLVGQLDGGWKLITSQLNRERLGLVNYSHAEQLLEEMLAWSKQTPDADGVILAEVPWVQMNFAKVKAGLEALKLLCYRQVWSMTKGSLDMADASATKVYGSEFFIETYRLLSEVAGQAATLKRDESFAPIRGRLESLYRVASILTFGGGANEVQRDIISAAGLWMPRAKR